MYMLNTKVTNNVIINEKQSTPQFFQDNSKLT